MRKENISKLKYTLKHKIAFLKVEKKLTGKISFRGIIHDIDKVLLMIFTNKTYKEIKKIHRNTQRHHTESHLQKTRKDYIEMVIDWECARVTKPDKPLNAYQTMYKYYPETEEYVIPILKEFNIFSPNPIDM